MRIRRVEPRGKRRCLHTRDQGEEGTRSTVRNHPSSAQGPEHEQGGASGLWEVPLEQLHQGGSAKGGVSPRDETGGLLAGHAGTFQLNRVLIRRRTAAGRETRVAGGGRRRATH